MLCSIVELWHEEGSPIFRVKKSQQLPDRERASKRPYDFAWEERAKCVRKKKVDVAGDDEWYIEGFIVLDGWVVLWRYVILPILAACGSIVLYFLVMMMTIRSQVEEMNAKVRKTRFSMHAMNLDTYENWPKQCQSKILPHSLQPLPGDAICAMGWGADIKSWQELTEWKETITIRDDQAICSCYFILVSSTGTTRISGNISSDFPCTRGNTINRRNRRVVVNSPLVLPDITEKIHQGIFRQLGNPKNPGLWSCHLKSLNLCGGDVSPIWGSESRGKTNAALKKLKFWRRHPAN